MTSPAHKLDGEMKALVFNMLAAYFKPNEVVDVLKEEHGIDISIQNIHYHKKQHHEEIMKLRDEFNAKIESIPITDKICRLQIRYTLVKDLIRNLWTERPVVDKGGNLVKNKKGEVVFYKTQGQHGEINRILDSIQKELEPSRVALTNAEGKESNLIFLPLDKIFEDSDNGKE